MKKADINKRKHILQTTHNTIRLSQKIENRKESDETA